MAVKFSNNGKTTLSSGITTSATSLTVADGSVLPAITGSESFFLTLEDTSGNIEIVKVTARSGNSLTVTRAQESTTARAFSAGDKAENRLTAAGLNSFVSDSGDTMTGNLSLSDNSKTTYGADDDLEIYHSSSDGHSYIHHTKAAVVGFPSTPSDLIIKGNFVRIQNEDGDDLFTGTSDVTGGTKLYHEGSLRFRTRNQWGTRNIDVEIEGNTDIDGIVYANGLDLEDNHYINIGVDNDLQLYHNGSQSIIHSTFFDLLIRSNDLKLTNANGHEYFTGETGGAATIFYNDSAKLATTDTGVDVTGTVTADSLTVINSDLSSQIKVGNTTSDSTEKEGTFVGAHYNNSEEPILGMYIRCSSSFSELKIGGGVSTLNGAEALKFYTASNNDVLSGTERMRIDNQGNVGIGNTIPASFGVFGAKDLSVGVTNGNHGITISSDSTSNGLLAFADNANQTTAPGYIDYDHNIDTLTIGTNATERVRIDDAGLVGIGTTSPKTKLQVEEYGIETTTTSTSATTEVAISSLSATDFRSARFTVQVTNTTDSTYHLTEILAIHDGTLNPTITEYGTIFTGAAAEATFDAEVLSGNFRLLATPATSDNMTFKVVAHAITV